jgi:hypothetical protein
VSSCTSRVGVAVRSIALEESVVAPAAQVSFDWKDEYPAETFGHTTGRTKQWLLRILWVSRNEGQSVLPCPTRPYAVPMTPESVK